MDFQFYEIIILGANQTTLLMQLTILESTVKTIVLGNDEQIHVQSRA